MKKDSYKNPFEGNNASQLEDKDILDFWCDPFSYRLFSKVREEDIFNEPNNLVFVGGRSCGKTMLLRYCSFPVQIMIANTFLNTGNGNINNYFKDKGGIGVYVRILGGALSDFNNKKLSDDQKRSLFVQYFELIVCRKYFEVINSLYNARMIKLNKDFIKEVNKLLGIDEKTKIDAIFSFLEKEIHSVDMFRGEIPFREKFDFKPSKFFASGVLSYGIPEIISKFIEELKTINFLIFIDEYENFLEPQQRVINTLIKFTKPNVKFRLSMRPEGFNTDLTVSDADFIKEGREYKTIDFDDPLIRDKDYNKFLIDVAKKRLENVKFFNDRSLTNIVSILGANEDLEKDALEITSKNPGKHFKYKNFKKITSTEIIDQIKYPKNPLLELLNLISLSRGIPSETIRKSMFDYLDNKKTDEGKKYRMDYVDKYKLSLMFLLCSIYRKDKLYYSFNTFSFLSSGIVGHFMDLCNKAFQYAAFEDLEKLTTEGKISKEQQNKAAVDISNGQLLQIQKIPDYGNLIYKLVNNIGNIFRDFHTDVKIRYPETNQFAAYYSLISDVKYKEAFKQAIRWSVIQKKKMLQRISIGNKQITDLYILNRIFSPIFQISYRTRGGHSIELNPNVIVEFMQQKSVGNQFLKKENNVKSLKSKNQSLGLFE